jgi:transposase
MLVVETVVRIRREHAGGKSIRAIARDLRLSRKAVRKAIGAPEGAFTYHRTVQPTSWNGGIFAFRAGQLLE